MVVLDYAGFDLVGFLGQLFIWLGTVFGVLIGGSVAFHVVRHGARWARYFGG